MNLIFIYGPPATGKLTIATELAKATGYVLFHNHLTLNLAREVLPDFDGRLFELTHKLRIDVIESAAKYEKNVIFTYVFDGDKEDIDFVNDVVKIVEKYGSRVHFVQLVAPVETILSRVGDDSRKTHNKIGDKVKLRAQLEERDMFASVPYEHILKIDTSLASPQQSSQKIIDTFGLDIDK